MVRGWTSTDVILRFRKIGHGLYSGRTQDTGQGSRRTQHPLLMNSRRCIMVLLLRFCLFLFFLFINVVPHARSGRATVKI